MTHNQELVRRPNKSCARISPTVRCTAFRGRGIIYALDSLPAEGTTYLWQDAYLEMTPRLTNIIILTQGTFDYIYDDYATLEAMGVVEADDITEARLVAAVGVSRPNPKRRDDSRLRDWVGPTGATFGDTWDKGHFIGHSIGGAVDGLEANVFIQLRSVNRGGYREMERYCAANSGVLCFKSELHPPSRRPLRGGHSRNLDRSRNPLGVIAFLRQYSNLTQPRVLLVYPVRKWNKSIFF